MKRLWSADELDERWMLSPVDLAFIAGHADAGRLGLASQLAFWRSQGRFPDEEADLAPAVIAHLAGQLGTPAQDIESYVMALAIGDDRARNQRRSLLTLSDNERALVLTLFDPGLAIGAPCSQWERPAHAFRHWRPGGPGVLENLRF